MRPQLLTLAETDCGLVLTLTAEGKNWLPEQTEGHDPLTGFHIWKTPVTDLLRRLLRNYAHWDTNREYLFPAPSDYLNFGWLTSAPVIVAEPETTKGLLSGFHSAYWFPDYAVRDELGELLENGHVVFPACPFEMEQP